MSLRQLGRSGIQVPPLAFGGNVLGWTVDEPTAFTLLDALLDQGLNFIDTADMYSVWVPGNQGGESETIIGNWFKARGNRARVVLATKVGMQLTPEKKGLSPAYIRRAVEDSLTRLQTDYIDLYQSHEDDPSVPQEEVLGAYQDLIKAGKVRAIGASNFTAARLASAIEISEKTGLPRYETLQPEYHLMARKDFEAELEPLVLDKGVGVINWKGLASGFLSGKYRSEADAGGRTRGKQVLKYLNPKGLQVLAALDEVAARFDANPAQVALAWLIARPSITAPIASATSLAQVDDLVAATKLKLDAEAIAQLDQASAY
jgi:aryl-alcohol dehydrogenase-like predicted oxidoreductase